MHVVYPDTMYHNTMYDNTMFIWKLQQKYKECKTNKSVPVTFEPMQWWCSLQEIGYYKTNGACYHDDADWVRVTSSLI